MDVWKPVQNALKLEKPLSKRDKWIAAVLLAVIVFGYSCLWHIYNDVNVFWRGDDLLVNHAQSSGLVVTHLITVAEHGETATATLPEPRLSVDSDTQVFDRPFLNRLTWRGRKGELLTPPVKGSKIYAVYYRPIFSSFRSP